jgi:uncharacterized protein YbaR (Trm112 family)
MRKELVDILVCPVCKQRLRLDVTDDKNGDVVSGSLTCTGCGHRYPVSNSIPNLLPPEPDKTP